ncbi:MAG: M14 family metallopeptidase [Alphaproteobacteria bacterium]|nr:M14 family metallopeptidase [Alphaproteobacteria bacterium]
MTNAPKAYFPSDYRAARAAFVAAAEAAGLGVTSRVHPSVKGRDGKPLFLDTATIGPRDAQKALLLISGTHGVEGYFGSGVQSGLLREGIAARVPEGALLVMLHAFNPYGFSWDRRVNEDNADLNRNFVDHARPPVNRNYAALADAIAPADITVEAMKAANATLRAYAEEHGAFALQAAISTGQYAFPNGIYYGGARESWSALMLRDIFREELAHVQKLVAIDFHTGLGDSGAAAMIIEDAPGAPAFARASALWGARLQSTRGGGSLSPPLTGTLDEAVARLMGKGETTFGALEVGTRPTDVVFKALRLDNWLHLHGSPAHSRAAEIKRLIRDAFYPDTADWKRAVWDHAHEAVKAALAAIA